MTNVFAVRPTPLTPNQIRGFIAAWGGWALDGMDSFIYSLVLVPALTELLPRSGIEATAGNIGFYGSVLFALFLIGWGLSRMWGPIADRFGRVRTLTLTILCYSLFTLRRHRHQSLAARGVPGARGHGIGGEWFIGATFVASGRRIGETGAGCMHRLLSGFLAALAITTSARFTAGAGCSGRGAHPPCSSRSSARRPRVGDVAAVASPQHIVRR
jgi:MFS family permease